MVRLRFCLNLAKTFWGYQFFTTTDHQWTSGIFFEKFTTACLSNGSDRWAHDDRCSDWLKSLFFTNPIITRNQFLISRGQTTLLTSDNIAATRNGTLAQDLQFIVSGTAAHGRFEQRSNPGSTISSFYQENILQQSIQFVHDNSTLAPQYALKVLDNQGGMTSDTQAGKTLLVINNYFPVNQGENLAVTLVMLNATVSQWQNLSDIVFTPITGTMQHGYFALTTSPSYPLVSFSQQQITQIRFYLCLIIPARRPVVI